MFPDFVVLFCFSKTFNFHCLLPFFFYYQTSEKFLLIQRYLPLLLNGAFLKLQGKFETSVVILFLLFSHSVVSNSLPPRGLQCQGSLSFMNSWSWLKLLSIEITTVIIYQLLNLFSVFLLSGRILLQRNPPISKQCFTPMKICSFPHNLYSTLL